MFALLQLHEKEMHEQRQNLLHEIERLRMRENSLHQQEKVVHETVSNPRDINS